jgi:16S rRNA (adenine1518-N6/adenine1519-N6)-dimethyltransferase
MVVGRTLKSFGWQTIGGKPMSNLPWARKSLGQHWLIDPSSLEAIAEAAELTPDETVLEIGPGPGALTKLLVQEAKQVIAVELDERLAEQLPGRVPADNLTVTREDILKFDLGKLPVDYKVVANIPYYLTSHLLRVLTEATNPPLRMVLLIQKEVAERIVAKPGNMSILSVSVQLHYQAKAGQVIEAHNFRPAPKVDSQVLVLNRRPQPLFENFDEKAFMRVVKAGFAARRKTLLNSLAGGLRLDKQAVEKMLETASLQPGMRPQELNLQQWHALYLAQ